VQRRCPHRNADLSVFGEIDGDDLVCTLHGWRFDLETGACRNAEERPIRVTKRI
jgi:UDP-MurNAc hydroxylase